MMKQSSPSIIFSPGFAEPQEDEGPTSPALESRSNWLREGQIHQGGSERGRPGWLARAPTGPVRGSRPRHREGDQERPAGQTRARRATGEAEPPLPGRGTATRGRPLDRDAARDASGPRAPTAQSSHDAAPSRTATLSSESSWRSV